MLDTRTVVVRDGKVAEVLAGRADVPGADRHRSVRPHLHARAGPTCTCTWASQSSPKSYEEDFRLDDVDFAFRSVGYAKKTLLAGFTSVRDLGGDVTPHLRNAINQGLVDGPRIWAAGKSIATTGGHADPTNGYNAELSHLIGPPGPTEGVINSVDDGRQAVRQRYKEGSDVIKITATGGVLSYAKSADAPQFTVDEVKAIVDTAKDYGYRVAAHAHGTEGMKRAVLGGVTIDRARHLHDRRGHVADEAEGHLVRADHRRRPLRRRQGQGRRLFPRDRAAQGRARRRADPGNRRQGLQGTA